MKKEIEELLNKATTLEVIPLAKWKGVSVRNLTYARKRWLINQAKANPEKHVELLAIANLCDEKGDYLCDETAIDKVSEWNAEIVEEIMIARDQLSARNEVNSVTNFTSQDCTTPAPSPV